ncbi:hypothetical protein LY12_005016 [Prauserella alba]|nr:hypothetical protein [Prauserella alba]
MPRSGTWAASAETVTHSLRGYCSRLRSRGLRQPCPAPLIPALRRECVALTNEDIEEMLVRDEVERYRVQVAAWQWPG